MRAGRVPLVRNLNQTNIEFTGCQAVRIVSFLSNGVFRGMLSWCFYDSKFTSYVMKRIHLYDPMGINIQC